MLDPYDEKWKAIAVEKPFVYECKGCQGLKIDTSITIPSTLDVDDHLAIFCSTYRVPVFIRDDLRKATEAFLETETTGFYDREADSIFQSLSERAQREDNAANEAVIVWTTAGKTYMPQRTVHNDDIFREAYQSLLKSDYVFVQQLLKKESEFAREMQNLIKERDWEVERLKKEHSTMIDKVVSEMGSVYSEQQVNQMAAEHFERLHLADSNYASQISSLATEQRRVYRELVLRLSEDSLIGSGREVGMNSSKDREQQSGEFENRSATDERHRAEITRLEESFTIHLGAQQKTMHNLRLISINPMELCNHKSRDMEESRRLQMALHLYSGQLHGVVLLVDSRPTYHVSFRTDFARACEQATELHFPDLENQLFAISNHSERANESRYLRSLTRSDDADGNAGNGASLKGAATSTLKPGDVYLTRHSNLSHVHVVFHLVADDTLQTQDISSRHPSINGLRNIIRLCYKFDITTINLPLLLIHNMTEELTVPWCVKRAELVFKCVKGFMMECATLSGAPEQYTVQFLVPPDVSADVFHQLSDILMSIFHSGKPVVEAPPKPVFS